MPLPRKVCPDPLSHHGEAIAVADEKRDMYECPDEPRNKARETHMENFRHCPIPPDSGERALIKVGERLRCLPSKLTQHITSGCAALLLRDRGKARKRFAVRSIQHRHITNNERFGIPGQREIRGDEYMSPVVKWHAERFGKRRWGNTCCPNHCARFDALVTNGHRSFFDHRHVLMQADFYTEAL